MTVWKLGRWTFCCSLLLELCWRTGSHIGKNMSYLKVPTGYHRWSNAVLELYNFTCYVRHISAQCPRMLLVSVAIALKQWRHAITWRSKIQSLPYLRPSLTTNQSYDQKFPLKISIQTSIKIRLKFHFEIYFYISLQKRSSYYFSTKGIIFWIPLDLLEGVYSTSFCIFDLRQIRLKTRYSERILFVSKGVSVTGFSNSRWEHNDYHENTLELGYNVMSVVITECYNVMVYREELIGTTEYPTL